MNGWNRRVVAIVGPAVVALGLSSLAAPAVAVTPVPARPAPQAQRPTAVLAPTKPSTDRPTPAPSASPSGQVPALTAPAGAWQALGPAPIGPTTLASGGFYGGKNSGRTLGLVQIPSGTHAGRIVLGAAGGGVWTSDNGGTTWTPRTDAQPILAIGAVAIDPNAPDHIVAGTGEANQCGDCFQGDGILNSTDGGGTWTRQDPGGVFNGVSISQIAIDKTNSLREFAATTSGLFKTTDGGTTWALPANASYANVAGRVTAVVVDSGGVVRVASATGTWIVSQSADHGVTFTETDTGIPHPSYASYPLVALAVAPSSTSTIYVSVGSMSAVTLWKNTTSGAGAWTHLTAAPDYTGFGYSYGSGSGEQGWYDNVIAVDPTNANHVLAGGVALVETTDGGTKWTNVNGGGFFVVVTNLIHPDNHALYFRADGKVLSGDDGGVYLYDPAGPTVTNLQGNLNITQFYFGFNAAGGQVLAGSQDNSSAQYSGSTAWTGIYGGDGGPSAITANHTATRFIEADQSLLVTTDDFATTLTDITPPTTGQNFTPPMIVVPSSSTPADPTVYYGGGNGLWRTTNPTTGPSWTDITGNMGSAVSAIAVAPSNPKYIYVGLDSGTVKLSTDGGTTFNPLPTQPFNGIANFVTGLAVNPAIPTQLTASFSINDTRYFAGLPHIGRYNGTSWSNITGSGLPSAAVSRVVYDGGTLVAATDTGVSASTDQGATWTAVGTGLPNVQVQDLDVESDGLYVVTHGRGAWKLSTTVPGAPTAVKAVSGSTATTTGPLTVTFMAPASNGGSAITSYTATCTSSNGGVTKTGTLSGATAAPITVASVTTGATYTCTVKAFNARGASLASAPSLPVTVGAPAAPTTVKAVSGSTTTTTGPLTVTFTIGANNGSAITSQTATCASSNGGATATGTHLGATAAPITVASVTTGKTYTCTVRATNARGASLASAPSLPVTVGAPAAPTGVTAANVAPGQIKVTFTPGANNGSATSSYTASCASSNGGVTGAKAGPASPLTVTGLTAGKTYTCTVTATNARGTSPTSNTSAAVTA